MQMSTYSYLYEEVPLGQPLPVDEDVTFHVRDTYRLVNCRYFCSIMRSTKGVGWGGEGGGGGEGGARFSEGRNLQRIYQ